MERAWQASWAYDSGNGRDERRMRESLPLHVTEATDEALKVLCWYSR